MKEAMRLHPAVGQLLERAVPPGGATIEEVSLLGGMSVGINPWAVSRDRTVYGKDADGFRPERRLESSPEQLRLMERNFLAVCHVLYVFSHADIASLERASVFARGGIPACSRCQSSFLGCPASFMSPGHGQGTIGSFVVTSLFDKVE